ncbi:hypothetical protein FRAHR75_1310007 [Frankia sp. Hr75.2]|nr:hypothetical protein FRAHR75_1310007 [Frankia sp. Hr75.2]
MIATAVPGPGVNGRLVTGATYWGPNDSHVGPSMYRTLTWEWDGRGFKLIS